MDTYKFINGVRTDTINDLNYTRLIHDNLYVGLLSRNSETWGTTVLFGIEYPTAELADLTAIENINLNIVSGESDTEAYYLALFNSDSGDDTIYTNTTTGVNVNLWKVYRINNKWVMTSNQGIYVDSVTKAVSDGDTYNDYRNSVNISNANYFINLYKVTFDDDDLDVVSTGTPPELLNTDIITIRCKNSDLDFYDANKTVYLSPSGMGYPIDEFQDLVLLENSKDSATIKLVNVTDSTIAKLNSGELNLTGRIFDVVDTSTNKIIIKGLVYDTFITLDDNSFLKFVYPTQNGDKVVLATIDVYENIHQIYPDYTVNLLTEIINDNTPPGIDVTQAMDNYLYESLFLLTDDINNGMDDLEFINTFGSVSDVNFVSLANERNRLYSGVNGFILDNSIFIGKEYGVDGVNWDYIKEYNLNKLLLNWTLSVESSATQPTPSGSTVNDLWYDSTNDLLKICSAVTTLTDDDDTSTITATTGTILIKNNDWSSSLTDGDLITMDGCAESGNNNTFTIDTITSDATDTTIIVTDETGMVDETLDADPDETIVVATWDTIPNDIRQIAVFYINDYDGVDEFIDLIYITNINKVSITDDIQIQLII